jgi:hypothetical protein
VWGHGPWIEILTSIHILFASFFWTQTFVKL